MNEHDIAEQAYNNGYEKGKQDAVKWISVKDRLPDKDGDYLIWVTVPFSGSKFMAVMPYEKDVSISIWQDTTYWMPLPEPPKGE